MKKAWIYAINFVLTATKKSFANAIRVSTFHLAALKAGKTDAAILAMYNAYLPLHNALVAAYNKWLAQTGSQKVTTVSLAALLKNLTIKMDAWDASIQVVYAKTTTNYQNIFPDGRKPFYKGTQAKRVNAVLMLSNALTGITALAAVKTDVGNYFTTLDTALSNKTDSHQTKGSLRDVLVSAIEAMANQQFANYGTLIAKYVTNLKKVNTFFDLVNIRNHKQTSFSHTIAGGATRFIAKRTFKANDLIYIRNTGITPLEFYLVPSKTSVPEGNIYLSGPDTAAEVPISLLGSVENATYLMVRNPLPNTPGSYEIELP